MEVQLPYVRSLIVVEKNSSAAARPEEDTVSYYLSSPLPAPAPVLAAHIRGHWGRCAIGNHWVRDARWAEDQTRSRNWNLNANLTLLRASLIALRAQAAPHLSWPARFERAAWKPSFPLQLVTEPRSK